MIKLLFTILAISSIFANPDPTSVESLTGTLLDGNQDFTRPDIVNMDFSLPTINKLYNSMSDGSTWNVNLKDNSKFTLERIPEVPESTGTERVPGRLNVKVYIFFPGDLKPGADPSTALHKAFEATYQWNDYLNVLVPMECEEDNKTVSSVDHKCEEAIHRANELLQLQITGNVRQQEFSDIGLERCIQSKIQLNDIVEVPYMKCLIKILGDPKYKDEILAERIKEKEAEGYICNDLGECFMEEDPMVVKALLENLKAQLDVNQEPVPINIPFDDRERFCAEHQVFQLPVADNLTQYSYDTYEYGCNHWVQRIYWHMDGGYKMKLATEYVSYTKGANGEPVFVSKEVQYTSRFELNNAKFLEVDWRNHERIVEMSVWRANNAPYATFSIEFVLAKKDGSDRRTVVVGLPMEGNYLNHNSKSTVNVNGEIVGWNTTLTGAGTIINGVDIKA
jgi:hypothetical protein